jgi:hypothetical protein
MIDNPKLLKKYMPIIKDMNYSQSTFKKSVLKPTFLLDEEWFGNDHLGIYYVPFEFINKDAKVILVGITPGWNQVKTAYSCARLGMLKGLSYEEILKEVDEKASFCGQMRKRLVWELDGAGLNNALKIKSCELLFNRRSDLLHSTSAVKYPVFVNGENYDSRKPEILDSLLLKKYIKTKLTKELKIVRSALIIPLGKTVNTAINYLIDTGDIEADRCLLGFLHPSPQYVQMPEVFHRIQPELRRQVNNWF